MPSKYIKRNFVENGTYHIYNRALTGEIFKDNQDYRVFEFYIFIYTSPKESIHVKYPDLPKRLESNNLSEELQVLAYSIMPDHFHLLLQQRTRKAVPKLMKQIANGYTLYFNQKYAREGSVFKGRYKAVKLNNDGQVQQLWRYIHLNPVDHKLCQHPVEYEWSSYRFFMGEEVELKVSDELISNFFKSAEGIEEFHTDFDNYKRQLEGIKELVIERRDLGMGIRQ